MSLFIGALAFHQDQLMNIAKSGTLAASAVSAVGLLLLRLSKERHTTPPPQPNLVGRGEDSTAHSTSWRINSSEFDGILKKWNWTKLSDGAEHLHDSGKASA
jgi:hypothetical protein